MSKIDLTRIRVREALSATISDARNMHPKGPYVLQRDDGSTLNEKTGYWSMDLQGARAFGGEETQVWKLGGTLRSPREAREVLLSRLAEVKTILD